MGDEQFAEMLQNAIDGDNNAMDEVLGLYKKLIYKSSYIDNVYDEDCKAYMEVNLIQAIRKFKI